MIPPSTSDFDVLYNLKPADTSLRQENSAMLVKSETSCTWATTALAVPRTYDISA